VTVRRTGVRVAGVVLIVAGVLVGVLLWVAAGQRYDDAVADLAPVPLGCTTTLAFERTGTYTFFVETKGEIGEIDGDCVTDGRTYDVEAEDTPRVSMSLVDDRGGEVDLDRADGPSYDHSGRRGVGVRTVEIDEAGDYRLTATATSDDAQVVVRVGRDPSSGVTALRIGGIAAFVLGTTIGLLLLLVLGNRRPSVAPAAPAAPPWPTGQYPLNPPVSPPTTNPAVPPPYAPRPPSHGPYQPPAPTPNEPGSRPPSADVRPGSGGPLPPPRPPR